MAGRTVLSRLRRVDLRLAQRVSRNRIGTLQGRLFWQAVGDTTYSEMPLYQFVDNGTGAAPWGGEETIAHRYSVQVDGDSWAAIRKLQGRYFIQPRPDDSMFPVEVEAQTEPDDQTYAQVTFKVQVQVDVGAEIQLP